MYEFFNKNALYLVLMIALIVWSGIFWYLSRLDRKVEDLERQANAQSIKEASQV